MPCRPHPTYPTTSAPLAQVLANRPDIVREDYMNELCVLQDDVPPFPDDQVGGAEREGDGKGQASPGDEQASLWQGLCVLVCGAPHAEPSARVVLSWKLRSGCRWPK